MRRLALPIAAAIMLSSSGGSFAQALEGASAGQLQRRGWTRESIKAGDTISVPLCAATCSWTNRPAASSAT